MTFDFRGTLKRYAQSVVIVTRTGGKYDEDTGFWIGGKATTTTIQAPVLPLNDDELQRDDGGEYTTNDRKIYVHQELQRGTEVTVGGTSYKVDAEKDYSYHAKGLRFYVLERRGASGD